MKIGDAVMEPLLIQLVRPPAASRTSSLPVGACGAESRPDEPLSHEFSGGQRQRICIARAL